MEVGLNITSGFVEHGRAHRGTCIAAEFGLFAKLDEQQLHAHIEGAVRFMCTQPGKVPGKRQYMLNEQLHHGRGVFKHSAVDSFCMGKGGVHNWPGHEKCQHLASATLHAYRLIQIGGENTGGRMPSTE